MNLTMLSVEQKLDRERDTHTQYKKRSSALVHIALKHTFPGSEKKRRKRNTKHVRKQSTIRKICCWN